VRDTVFLAYRNFQRSIRVGDWKLIRYPEINRAQLFNLAADPAEIHDLAAEPASESKVNDLMARLAVEQQRAGDTLPLISAQPKDAAVDAEFFQRAAR
jgi:hypothetical protein